ncbi:HAD-IA family hydrolase [Paenibacillus lutrae]|uniref:HAD-IA family hydrolase n=1 Tax=Paenibacillus lutrae TaxID=2078573 RepID=A0A7X3FLF7_9BACL|nr:HAD-IA family hydrolase [Paenibacillus lutrae]MVP01457.1 HAD-IA family hydrolase [Paenibacillus lutrae]
MDQLVEFIDKQTDVAYVFFDVFDTILLREVDPEYTKKIWSKRMAIQLGDVISYEELYRIRFEMESSLCKQNEADGFDLEFNYSKFIHTLYKYLMDIKIIDAHYSYENFFEECKQIELEVEKAVQYVDPKWIEVADHIKNKLNVRMVCVSDFYLTQDMMKDLFNYHKILDYFDLIYVSSEYLITKRSGRLFDKILEEQSINPKTVVMVGDNEISDFEMAKKKEINAYLLDRNTQRDFYTSFSKKNSIQKIREELNKLAKNTSKLYPFEEIIFSLFLYVALLHRHLIKNRVRNVFFLSREGEYLLNLFNIYQDMEGYKGIQYITPHYLKVSRRATFLPSLKSLAEEDFEILFRQYRNISLYDFLSSLGFEDSIVTEVSNRIRVAPRNKEPDFPTSDTYYKLKEDEFFKEIYEKSRQEQKANFLLYMKAFKVDIFKEGMYLVDVGWKGTIQDNIYRIFESQVNINGAYLGLVASGNSDEHNIKEGLLFSAIPIRTPYFDVFNENRALYEIILGASHGSANRYILSDGEIAVETKQDIKEKEIFTKIVSPMQINMQQTFKQICNLLCKKNINIDELRIEFAKIHSRLVYFPTRKEISFFNGLYHFENFGVIEYTEFTRPSKKGIVHTMKNTVKMLTKPRSLFTNSFWGPITLENAGLHYLIKLYGHYKYRKSFNIDSDKPDADYHKVSTSKEVLLLQNKLNEQDEAIKKMTLMIDDRDDAIKSMTIMIDERDKLIKELNEIINEHKTTDSEVLK